MISNTRESRNPKGEIYKYIQENNLVEIKKMMPIEKQPQIDFGYGAMLVEVLDRLKESTQKDKIYNDNGLSELIVDNKELSISFVEHERKIESKEIAYIRFNNRVKMFVNLIYYHCEKDVLTIQEVLEYAKTYQENYYYNI